MKSGGKHKPYAHGKIFIRNNRTGFSYRTKEKVKIFVDSGASITILPPAAHAILEQKTGKFDVSEARMLTANGVRSAKALKDVSFCLNKACFRGNILVSDGFTGDALIGSDFLRKTGCVVDFKKRTLTCAGKRIPFSMER